MLTVYSRESATETRFRQILGMKIKIKMKDTRHNDNILIKIKNNMTL
jgi:hypothetical protein